MESEHPDEHLSEIPTLWSVVCRAKEGAAEDAGAVQQLIQRYHRPIYRYLLACLREADAAEELFQEFALSFVRGDFRNVDPGRGRFRHYLKTVLYHLVAKYRTKRQLQSHQPLPPSEFGPVVESPVPDSEDGLREEWRKELIVRAMDALARWETQKRQPLHTVLRFRSEHPDLRAAQMAERLSTQLGTTVTAEWVYKKLHLAREKLASFLVDEVAQTLSHPTREEVEQELLELNLLGLCRDALERRASH
jgi:RNA polymerase sigma-70 factor (ECF subfamily)